MEADPCEISGGKKRFRGALGEKTPSGQQEQLDFIQGIKAVWGGWRGGVPRHQEEDVFGGPVSLVGWHE